MKIRKIAISLLASSVILSAAACSKDDDKTGDKAAASSSATSQSSDESSESPKSTSESAASSSPVPTDANGREILPSTQPEYFTPEDTSAPFKYGHIVDYVNQYPGWIVLSTEEPKYDAEQGGYRVNVYFNAEGGSDIILRDEFTMIVDGQAFKAEPIQPTGMGGPTDFLADKTPIGNRSDASKNYAFGDIVFKMPQTQSALEMHYDNKDGDVHIVWSPTGKD